MTEPMSGATGATSYGQDRPTLHPADHSRPDVEDRSVGELIGEVAKDLSTLMRKEIELAKVELKAEATKAGKGAGMLAGAGVAGHLFLIFFSLTLVFALDNFMGMGWAALIVALLWAVIAGVLAAMGKKNLQQVGPPEQTIESVKEDAEWLKTRNS